MKIPIRNVYYLLCYAWDVLPQADTVSVGLDDAATTADLLAHVLINGVTHLLKRGVMREYCAVAEAVAGVRGKLLIAETVKKQLHLSARTYCAYDELDSDVLPNQIIKATLRALSAVNDLDNDLRQELAALRHRFGDVTDIRIYPRAFGLVQLHRHIATYKLLLSVCQLVHASLMPDEGGTARTFRDFVRDDLRMAQLFQQFVFNFYRREQQTYVVDAQQIRWRATCNAIEDERFLPLMQTDVVLTNSARTIVLDTKYYRESFQSRFGKEKIHSDHLYQILSYLQNLDSQAAIREGILLYPTVKQSFDLRYTIIGFPVRVTSIDLDQPWQSVRDQLLTVVHRRAAA